MFIFLLFQNLFGDVGAPFSKTAPNFWLQTFRRADGTSDGLKQQFCRHIMNEIK